MSFLLNGIRNGVDIGYSGIPTPMIHNNWPSAYTHRKPVEAHILRDLHIPVRIEDHPLLGTSWNYIDQQGGVIKQYFMDTVLPFGLKSSAKLFNKYADGLEYVMKRNGVSICEHYLDE